MALMTILRRSILIVVLAFVPSAAAANLTPAPARLVGTYTATVPNYPDLGWYKGRYKLILGPKSTFAVHDIPGLPNITYGASYPGNHIPLPYGQGCATPGTYAWTLHGTKLDIKLVSDPCRGRAAM